MIKNWLLVISGFTEDIDQPTGTMTLWQNLRPFSNHETCVQLRNWNEDWQAFARFMRLNSVDEPRILVAAYSWGAGYGFIQLAKQLQDDGESLWIDHAILCDPVYRSHFLSTRWLAFLPQPKITVPWNVEKVSSFYQENSLPKGHSLKRHSRGGDTCIFPPQTLADAKHTDIDEHPNYHAQVLVAAEELTKG